MAAILVSAKVSVFDSMINKTSPKSSQETQTTSTLLTQAADLEPIP